MVLQANSYRQKLSLRTSSVSPASNKGLVMHRKKLMNELNRPVLSRMYAVKKRNPYLHLFKLL